MDQVLIVINKEGIVIHAGEPEGFSNTLIYSYAMDGYTIKTIDIKEWNENGYQIYKPVPE